MSRPHTLLLPTQSNPIQPFFLDFSSRSFRFFRLFCGLVRILKFIRRDWGAHRTAEELFKPLVLLVLLITQLSLLPLTSLGLNGFRVLSQLDGVQLAFPSLHPRPRCPASPSPDLLPLSRREKREGAGCEATLPRSLRNVFAHSSREPTLLKKQSGKEPTSHRILAVFFPSLQAKLKTQR